MFSHCSPPLNSDFKDLVYFQSEELVNKLEKELDEKKGKEEQDKSYLKISDDATKRNSGTSPVKDSKMIKQLWDEISKKDIRMQDLEKYA